MGQNVVEPTLLEDQEVDECDKELQADTQHTQKEEKGLNEIYIKFRSQRECSVRNFVVEDVSGS